MVYFEDLNYESITQEPLYEVRRCHVKAWNLPKSHLWKSNCHTVICAVFFATMNEEHTLTFIENIFDDILTRGKGR